MPNRINPSYCLSLEEVDDIVDRTLKGKYAKVPVTTEEIIKTGLFLDATRVSIRGYVISRWTLTNAGITMRSNKLAEKMREQASFNYRELENHGDAVWAITTSRHRSQTVYVTCPGKIQARNTAWLIWGWMWADEQLADATALYATFIGLGGLAEMNDRNSSLIESLESNLSYHRRELEFHQAKFNDFYHRLQMAKGVTAISALDAVMAE